METLNDDDSFETFEEFMKKIHFVLSSPRKCSGV